MHYVLLLIPILMWSFVGILVKTAALSFSPALISFFRFSLGVAALGLYFLARGRKPALRCDDRWIWIAAAGKSINYVLENVAITMGYSWGYIVEYPVQAVALLALSAIFFRERVTARKVVAMALCAAGATAVGGAGFSVLRGGGPLVFLLFIVAACGSALHLAGQKKLIARMASGDLNLSVFLLASGLTALPLPLSGPLLSGPPILSAVAAMIALGAITGLSFLLWGALIARVPLLFAGLFSNLSVIFVLVWGALLYGDPIGPWAIGGTALFLSGLVLIGLPAKAGPDPRRSA